MYNTESPITYPHTPPYTSIKRYYYYDNLLQVLSPLYLFFLENYMNLYITLTASNLFDLLML